MALARKKILRKYKQECKKPKSDICLPFGDFNLSHKLDIPEGKYWYSSTNNSEYIIELDDDDPDYKRKSMPKNSTEYKQIIDILPNFTNDIVNEDWLTGFYIGSAVIPQFLKNHTPNITCYMTGHTLIANGIHHYCYGTNTTYNQQLAFDIYFTDNCKNHSRNLKGALQNGDSSDPSNISHIHHELTEKLHHKLLIGIVDIESPGKILINRCINILYNIDIHGIAIIRIPPPTKWDTLLINALYLICCIFAEVKFWKTPWSDRCYLIACGRKNKLTKTQYIKIQKYLHSAKKILFTEELFKLDATQEWQTNILQLLDNGINNPPDITSEEWFNTYGSNFVDLRRPCPV